MKRIFVVTMELNEHSKIGADDVRAIIEKIIPESEKQSVRVKEV